MALIKTLKIERFKSLLRVNLSCKKVNVFIGKPNTGKSNILESVGLFSIRGSLRDYLRFETTDNLFYDNTVEEPVLVQWGPYTCTITFKDGNFAFVWTVGGEMKAALDTDYRLSFLHGTGSLEDSPIRFYRFRAQEQFPYLFSGFLNPPHGDNLLAVLQTRKTLRNIARDLFAEYGLRIVLKPQDHKIEVQKLIEDVAIAYPYSTVSDTLQRVLFYLAAIETNQDSVLVFEEPEASAFPYYTKYLAERIALDATNQYFISTHNPYFLLSLIEKTPKGSLAVFVTYFEDYQTKVKELTEDEITRVEDLAASVFLNLEEFLPATAR
jgi:predicted ATPase